MTITACAQAALDLIALNEALAEIAIGARRASVTYADKTVSYGAADVALLRDLIRAKQAEVDACNGIRGRNRAFRFVPSGW